MIKKLHKLSENSFIKNIIILASGSILAQILNFAFSPIITRIYTPEEMGNFTLVLTIVTMFSMIINARYDLCIVNETEEQNSIDMIKLSFIIGFILSVVISILVYLYYFFNPTSSHSLKINLLWIFPLLLIANIINILNAYNNRHREYKILTKVYVLRSLSQNLLMIIIGIFNSSAFVLLFSQFFGQFFGLFEQSKALRKKLKELNFSSLNRLLYLANKNKKQPLFSVPSTFLNSAAYSLINILISILYGNAYLGLYSISYRILGVPLTIFSSNISRIHFEKSISEKKISNSFFSSTKRTFILSIFIAIPMAILLIAFSPLVFGFIFGEAWKEAGVYVQILAPMFSFRLITGCIGHSFILCNKQQYELIFQVLLCVSLIVVYFISSIFNNSIYLTLFIISVLFSAIYIMEIFTMFKFSKESVL